MFKDKYFKAKKKIRITAQLIIQSSLIFILHYFAFCPQDDKLRVYKYLRFIRRFNIQKPNYVQYARAQLNKVVLNNKSKKTIDYVIIEDKRRTGNAIISINKAMGLCYNVKCSVIFHNNFWFLSKNIKNKWNLSFESIDLLNHPKYQINQKNYISGDFFCQYYYDQTKSDDIYEIIGKNLLACLPYAKIDKNALYIHIRSGDIFQFWPENQYAQPPLCFYRKLMRNWNFSNVFIISEDRVNPVINRLIESGATLLITNLPITMAIMTNAKNVAIGRGTFMFQLMKISVVPKNLWCYNGKPIQSYGKSVEKMYNMNASEIYKKKMLGRKWYNTKNQRRIMIESKCFDFREEKR